MLFYPERSFSYMIKYFDKLLLFPSQAGQIFLKHVQGAGPVFRHASKVKSQKSKAGKMSLPVILASGNSSFICKQTLLLNNFFTK